MDTAVYVYQLLFRDLADSRVINWPFMSDPLLPSLVILIYIKTIFHWLPKYMENRPAFDLKTVLRYYNLFQIIYCSWIVYGISTSGWLTHFSWGCQVIDYTDNPESVRLLKFMYLVFILKIIDLIETGFFILRKKQNQVTNLHLYHHISTMYYAWVGVKYCGGGMASLYPMLNSAVHVIMYTYYFLATFGPNMQKRLAWYKSKLTTIQMVQFAIILFHMTFAYPSDCHVPKGLALLFGPNVILIFYMFYQFYVQSYVKKGSKGDLLCKKQL